MAGRQDRVVQSSVIVDATVGLATSETSRSAYRSAAYRLRRLITQPEVLLVPTAHDAFSARLVELAGFEASAMNRRGITASVLASVDDQVADPQELLTHTAGAALAVSIPLIVDFSPGPYDVMRLRRALVQSIDIGLAGFVIGDALPGGEVLADDDADVLVRAALDLRADNGDIVVIGKARAADPGGVQRAIARALRWAELGIDLVQIDQLPTRHDHETFAATVPERRVHSSSAVLAAADHDESLAHEFGYAVAICPTVLLEAAAAGMQAALDRINREHEADAGETALPQADLDVLLGARAIDELRRRY